MSVDNFKPEIWSASILSKLGKSQVFANCANRNYEGEISAYGDTVHITSVDDVSVSTYVPNQDLADPELLSTTEQLMVIDQGDTFHFYLDDLDAAQVRNAGALLGETGQRAAYSLRDKVDKWLAAMIAGGADSDNALGVIDGSTVTNVYDKLVVAAGVALDEQNVPEESRWLVISPSTYGLLQLDSRFIEADKSGNGALHNGVVGMAGGFQIMKSNNAFQANRVDVAATAASGDSAVVGAAGAFSQGDVGLTVSGTGIAASTVVSSVSADGTTANLSKDTTAAVTKVTLAGGGQLAYAGSSIATTYANQISEIVGYSPEKRFGDAVKGLHVYGGRVIRPEALVVASVKTS